MSCKNYQFTPHPHPPEVRDHSFFIHVGKSYRPLYLAVVKFARASSAGPPGGIWQIPPFYSVFSCMCMGWKAIQVASMQCLYEHLFSTKSWYCSLAPQDLPLFLVANEIPEEYPRRKARRASLRMQESYSLPPMSRPLAIFSSNFFCKSPSCGGFFCGGQTIKSRNFGSRDCYSPLIEVERGKYFASDLLPIHLPGIVARNCGADLQRSSIVGGACGLNAGGSQLSSQFC